MNIPIRLLIGLFITLPLAALASERGNKQTETLSNITRTVVTSSEWSQVLFAEPKKAKRTRYWILVWQDTHRQTGEITYDGNTSLSLCGYKEISGIPNPRAVFDQYEQQWNAAKSRAQENAQEKNDTCSIL